MTGPNETADTQDTYERPTTTRVGVFAGRVVPLLLIVALPISVHAGVFSSLAAMLQEDAVVYERNPNKESIHDARLLSANNSADPNAALGGGDVIVDEGALISSGSFGEDEMAQQKTFSGEISVYTVRNNNGRPDTLSEIAEMYDVTVNTIMWANDIDDPSLIQPGDTLVILPIVGVRHVVKSGDDINSIAKKYDADSEEILDYNQLDESTSLAVGDTLIIPGGEIAQPARSVASTPVQYSGSSASTNSGGGFTHPAPGTIRTQGIHGYNGVDLAGSYGSAIRAAAAGEVVVAKGSGWNGGYGAYIVLRHGDGTQTLYAHLSSVSVGVGGYVAAGETIGGMGNSGRSTGVHLHFEVRGARNPF